LTTNNDLFGLSHVLVDLLVGLVLGFWHEFPGEEDEESQKRSEDQECILSEGRI
jgi:hypothetical protein